MIGMVSAKPQGKQAAKSHNDEWARAVEAAKRLDCIEVVGRYVQLRKCATHEHEGPCPRCGGDDRLHVKREGWFCRQCKPLDTGGHGWHDAPNFLMFARNLTFPQAVTELTGASFRLITASDGQPVTKATPKPPPPPEPQTDAWRARVQPLVSAAQFALLDADTAGGAYLAQRGLEPGTWATFGFGFGSYKDQPCIVIPWTRGGLLWAVRYRFIHQVDGPKILSEPGSKFAGALYGGQAIMGCAEKWRTLVICEGELNAASIWQACRETNVDVLSLGSESATLPESAIKYAEKFRRVVVWMDKREVAEKLSAMLPGATAYWSPITPEAPKGLDANDLLKLGKLGGVLAGVRLRGCMTDEHRAALKWDLWDALNLRGVEDGGMWRFMEGMQ